MICTSSFLVQFKLYMTDVTMKVFFSFLFIIVLYNNNCVRCQLSEFTGNESGLPTGVMSKLKIQSQQDPPEVEEYECGRSSIEGGPITKQGEWPWHGALYHKINGSTNNVCGCTLISKSRVVTAAQCLYNMEGTMMSENSLTLSFGTTKRVSPDANRKYAEVKKLKVHEEFDRKTLFNNIAILDISIELNEFIKPVCIWKEINNSVHVENMEYGTIVAWAPLGKYNGLNNLQKIRVPLARNDLCQENLKEHFDKRQFCIGEPNLLQDPCLGVSGGGVFFNETSMGIMKWYLGGVVSLDYEKCDTVHYSAHTLVEKYYDFITMNIE